MQAAAVLTGRTFDDLADGWGLGSAVSVEPDPIRRRRRHPRRLRQSPPGKWDPMTAETFRDPTAAIDDRVRTYSAA